MTIIFKQSLNFFSDLYAHFILLSISAHTEVTAKAAKYCVVQRKYYSGVRTFESHVSSIVWKVGLKEKIEQGRRKSEGKQQKKTKAYQGPTFMAAVEDESTRKEVSESKFHA